MKSKDAMKKLEFIDDVDLFRSVSLALWLYLDQERTLKYSIDTASKKRGGKKYKIERLVRTVVPQSIISSRKVVKQEYRNLARARHITEATLKKYN